ncbi:MAG TPA: hypothetical protein VF219_10125 [Vicinamibacterales bacterium]
MPVMHDDIETWLEVMADAIREHVNAQFAPVIERLVALEAREPLRGPPGEKGADGRDGVDGRDGTDGRDGADGRDGKDGLDGKNGLDGENGRDGKDGTDGLAGRDGIDGIDGKDGERGIDGRDGRDGKDGRDGADGRDALDLEVLPAIDFSRSYPRGTFATHQGGLWRAHANTDGEHGWSCIVDGIASVAFESSGARQVAMAVTRSSGHRETWSYAPPVALYRGVYIPDRDYEPGDMVTWAGSVWHCNAATRERPDAGGGSWTLAVKRGRDSRPVLVPAVREAGLP